MGATIRFLALVLQVFLFAVTTSCPIGFAGEFPRTYWVIDSEVLVRSGPGDNFYATAQLSRGDAVEVVRLDDEWAAIRPPEGSFCWIERDAIAPTGRKLSARVLYDGVRTRVGSRFTQERKVAYATLQQGDLVGLVDPLPSASETEVEWVKIRALPGELRWVPLTSISDEEGTDTRKNGTEDGEMVETEKRTSEAGDETEVVRAQWSYDLAPRTYTDKSTQGGESEPTLATEPSVDGMSLSKAFGELRQAVQELNSAVSDQDGSGATLGLNTAVVPVQATENILDAAAPSEDLLPPPTSRAGAVPPDPLMQSDPGSPSGTAASPSLDTRIAGGPGRQEMLRITVELTRMIANTDARDWELGALRSRAQAVVDTGESTEIRQGGQELIARIAQFEDIQRRKRQLDADARILADTKAGRDATNRAAERQGLEPNALAVAPTDNNAGYNGSGWLMPVASNRPGMPRYVLTDNSGNILQFVSPRTGLNLRRYERKRVGIYGEQGYLPSVSQPILTAERVISLDRVR